MNAKLTEGGGVKNPSGYQHHLWMVPLTSVRDPVAFPIPLSHRSEGAFILTKEKGFLEAELPAMRCEVERNASHDDETTILNYVSLKRKRLISRKVK